MDESFDEFWVGVDGGGTNSRRGAYYRRRADGRFVPVMKGGKPLRDKVPTADFPGLVPMVRQFLAANEDVLGNRLPRGVGYGYAGAFQYSADGRYGRADKGVNMPWSVDDEEQERDLGCPFKGCNDLTAMAFGTNFLDAGQVCVLAGDTSRLRRPAAKVGWIAPGTGTGASGGEWDGKWFVPTRETEFGHTRFAPYQREDTGYLNFLWDRLAPPGRVSTEAALNLWNVYRYMRDAVRIGPEPEEVRALLEVNADKPEKERQDPAPLICQLALKAQNALCEAALKMYARLIGAAASDFTLALKAFDGCLIGGGNVAKIGEVYLRASALVPTFVKVGHHQAHLSQTPIVLLLAETGDWGAAFSIYRAQGGEN